MKRQIVYIILLLTASCQEKPASKRLASIMTMPVFQIEALDSSRRINTADLPPGQHTLFMYFSPNCEHCQKMTRLILANQGALRDTRIFMVTNEASEEARKFAQTFKLVSYKNLFIGTDYIYTCFDAFMPSELPFFAIYDNQRKLKRIYRGETDIHSIINSINE